MKKYFLVIIAAVLIAGCTRDTVAEHYIIYTPVYSTKDAVRANIRSSSPDGLIAPGKLVWKDNFIFLNDVDRGIHVIDISDPSHARPVAFINIPGCMDLAVNGNYLYADCYTDLVTIDISDPLNISLKQFLPGVFPHRAYSFAADTNRVITTWIAKDTVVSRRFDERSLGRSDVLWISATALSSSSYAFSSPAGIGLAGSTARFALMNQHMYTVSYSDLKIFDLINAGAPAYTKTLPLSGVIETIYPFNQQLFIGSQTGMFIYDVSKGDQPVKKGQFTHVRSCDPVIADQDFAYVTLKSGTVCGGSTNELDILDVKSLLSPKLISTYSLTSPSGLSKDGNLLFVCDGPGLKIMNTSNLLAVSTIKEFKGFEPTDVIAQKGIAVVVAKDGLHIIDYASPVQAKEISRIPLSPKR